jgi:predicted nucleic-acid-binding protein
VIAVDTNVLLRRLLQDDPAQAAKVNALFDRESAILVTDVVLAETAWTLTGKRYGASRSDMIAAVSGLFEEPAIRFEDRHVVWAALQDYAEAPSVKTANGTRTADLADALIARKAAATLLASGKANARTYTFDQPAQQLPGMKAL